MSEAIALLLVAAHAFLVGLVFGIAIGLSF